MGKMKRIPLKVEESITDFVFKGKVEESTIEKYRGKIPDQMIELWEKYGYGTILNGYLKIVNPDDYIELMEEATERHQKCPVIFTTGMGDLLAWRQEDVGFLTMLNFRHGESLSINAELTFFFQNLSSEAFIEKFKMNPYPKAVELYGPLEYDECF